MRSSAGDVAVVEGPRNLRPTVANASASMPATTKPTIQRAAPLRRGADGIEEKRGSPYVSSFANELRMLPGVGVAGGMLPRRGLEFDGALGAGSGNGGRPRASSSTAAA
jgi:hypothetical protein